MTKAEITTRQGTKIVIEGSSDEVASVISDVQRREIFSEYRTNRLRNEITHGPVKSLERQPPSLTGYLFRLRTEGFFNSPRKLGNIISKLAEVGFGTTRTTLSSVLLLQVRHGLLKRSREDGVWVYSR